MRFSIAYDVSQTTLDNGLKILQIKRNFIVNSFISLNGSAGCP